MKPELLGAISRVAPPIPDFIPKFIPSSLRFCSASDGRRKGCVTIDTPCTKCSARVATLNAERMNPRCFCALHSRTFGAKCNVYKKYLSPGASDNINNKHLEHRPTEADRSLPRQIEFTLIAGLWG